VFREQIESVTNHPAINHANMFFIKQETTSQVQNARAEVCTTISKNLPNLSPASTHDLHRCDVYYKNRKTPKLYSADPSDELARSAQRGTFQPPC